MMILSMALVMVACGQNETPVNTEGNDQVDENGQGAQQDTLSGQKIQVALLLDTSSSMDGLIDQAKMRLWNIVNTLTTLRYNRQEPEIEIALYEYGNDRLSAKEDWVRLIVPLTRDLDEISEKLFALRTNGGTEYCGSVINHAVKNLLWNDHENSLKLVYIAGNEEFNQHGFNFKEAISGATQQDIFVNTIYCGDYESGVSEFWRDGANLGQGKYFNIDSDKAIQFVATPYDDSIAYYNRNLNDTYVSFSLSGNANKAKQVQQDESNQAMSQGAYIERSISKTKSSAYDNSHWDLADKYKKEPEAIKKMKKEDLPAALKDKSPEELEAHAKKLLAAREKNQKAIQQLSLKRQQFIDAHQKNKKKDGDDFGEAVEKSIYALAQIKGYSVAP